MRNGAEEPWRQLFESRNPVSFRIVVVFSSPDRVRCRTRTPSLAQELLAHQAFLRRLAIDLVGEDADDMVQDYRGAIPRVRAADHRVHVTNEGLTGDRITEVSAPGIYEISFEDSPTTSTNRSHPGASTCARARRRR